MTNSDGDPGVISLEALENVTETTMAKAQPHAAKLYILIYH